jgi:hypothetical protein
VRELTAEVETLRGQNCKVCGATREDEASTPSLTVSPKPKAVDQTGLSIVDRPRAKTGAGSRALFGSGGERD